MDAAKEGMQSSELRAQLQTTQICLDKKQQPGVLSLTYWVANKPALNLFKLLSQHVTEPNVCRVKNFQQGSQNFKIPCSPSGRDSSVFGSPK